MHALSIEYIYMYINMKYTDITKKKREPTLFAILCRVNQSERVTSQRVRRKIRYRLRLTIYLSHSG